MYLKDTGIALKNELLMIGLMILSNDKFIHYNHKTKLR